MALTVRKLASPAEFEEAEVVQLKAWGLPDYRGVTPKEIMIAMHDNGGQALGAFEGERMVGFAIMMAGRHDGTSYLYSHQTGVIPEYHSKGVGYLLKQKQKEVALEMGFGMMAWTFDPIIARNAYFNIGKLAAVARNYHVDYYGMMRDSINSGWPTDRFLAEWYIAPHKGESGDSGHREHPDAYTAIKTDGQGTNPKCIDWGIELGVKQALVQIPGDIVGLKRSNASDALRWREATRDIFQKYFAAGFSAVSVLRKQEQVFYVLEKAELPKNIFG